MHSLNTPSARLATLPAPSGHGAPGHSKAWMTGNNDNHDNQGRANQHPG